MISVIRLVHPVNGRDRRPWPSTASYCSQAKLVLCHSCPPSIVSRGRVSRESAHPKCVVDQVLPQLGINLQRFSTVRPIFLGIFLAVRTSAAAFSKGGSLFTVCSERKAM